MPPANSTSHRFAGRWDKQYDTTSSLVLMGVRPYDPNLGRFLAVDPIPGGALNNYDYAGQDPINVYDLDGTREKADEADAGDGGDPIRDEPGDDDEVVDEGGRASSSSSSTGWGWRVQDGDFKAPDETQAQYDRLKESGFKTRDGYRGGGEYKNTDKGLPPGDYKEYNVNPTKDGGNSDQARIVVNTKTGEAYWTNDHYESFYRLN